MQNGCINAQDADLMLQMEAHMLGKDFLAWHYECNGLFSAKRSYKLACSLANNTQNLPSTCFASDRSQNLWIDLAGFGA